MYIIVGLGNPGREYVNTRHNIGFQVLEKLAEQEGISVLEKKHKAVIGRGIVAGQKCILARPLTYMNLSGESVREMVDYYKADETAELIIVSDDISLDVGQIRIRKKGSAGGHNGLKSIIAHLGHDSFIRIKMGVGGKPEGWDLADYVLAKFDADALPQMEQGMDKAAQGVELILSRGINEAMNRINQRPKPPKAPKEPKPETENEVKA